MAMSGVIEATDSFWETFEVIRYLQEVSNSTGNSTNSTLLSPNDGQVLRNTMKVYGSIFAVCFFVFCCLRLKYPKAFDVRSWSPDPDTKCDLANEKYGFISWLWQVQLATDDEIREQCGMDALCFLRVLYFGYRICLVGIFNSFWLFPVYATGGGAETAYITDRVAQLTVSYLPAGSPRLVATVMASYVVFFYVMYLIMQEYNWFTYHRHCYLSTLEPRNFSVYVANIPRELQSNQKLLEYFQDCFPGDCVLEANVALKIPKLEKLVAKRDSTVLILEHLINLEEVKGKTPMRRSINPREPPQDAIKATLADLNELNTQVTDQITEIEAMHRTTGDGDDRSLASRSYACGFSVNSGITNMSSLAGGNGRGTGYSGSGYSMPSITGGHGTARSVTSDIDGSERLDMAITLSRGESKTVVVNASATEAFTYDDESKRKSKNSGESTRSHGIVGSLHKGLSGGVSNVTSGVSKVASGGLGLATSAVGAIRGGDDGEPRSGAFISFKKLRSRQAALQMVHNATPFCMQVSEGPDPDSIRWSNVGKSNKELQVGTLISFSLTAFLCFFWTIPVSFIASLTSVDSLSRQVPFLANWVENAPWLGDVLAVLAPLLLIAVNALLPTFLEMISSLEGPLGEGALSASTFTKLCYFMIIQTFFVSAVSGSIFEELSDILAQPQLAIDLLGTSLPAQSTYFLQILLVSTFIGLSTELLRVSPFAIALGRSLIGPNLTEAERQRTIFGFLRPLSDPLDFQHPEVGSNNALYFMVLFVYTAMAPLVNWFLAFCFLLMNSAYRYQFFCNYPQKPDSGGQMWISFIKIAQYSLIVAQITLFGFLALKRTAIAIPLLVPLLVINILFQWYVNQKHDQVATFLPSRESMLIDRKNNAEGPMDFSFLKDEYKQPQLKAKGEVLPENLTISREVAHGNDTYKTPPGSEADIEDLQEDEARASLLSGRADANNTK
eukprot:CAMPEP_0202490390 /NCGR_PEP_ID=MMETSP1361-20130828/7807_1 /ASSEMBLY_ACC=CAM_ASM_000849 /TAXON_ID=210615 /ORGANISM="Staurosira complex sp., Strain CCMP2646" /LENGTH=954 /DNA_ID=CAMNT_0049120269 /DNA_START=50 /DNA_END=2914 /DNA_ORIENTATION=-